MVVLPNQVSVPLTAEHNKSMNATVLGLLVDCHHLFITWHKAQEAAGGQSKNMRYVEGTGNRDANEKGGFLELRVPFWGSLIIRIRIL